MIMFVKNAMTSNVQSCHMMDSLDNAARLMWDFDCGAIPIVDHTDKPVGIVTDRDLTMASMLNHLPLWELTPSDIVSQQTLSCCHVDDKLEDCLKIMEGHSIRRLPVINDSGYLAGMLSIGDVIAFASNKVPQKKQKNILSFDDVIKMLKQVSAHHEEPDTMPLVAV